MKQAIAKVLAEEKDGRSALDATLIALRKRAVQGDVRAAQELLDRAYGKAKQSFDHTTDGQPLPPILYNFAKTKDDDADAG